MNRKDVVELVGRYLKDKHPGGATLEALSEGVRHEEDWWYIPVRPSFEPPRRYEYYEALANVETEMLTRENIIVLLLPTSAEEKAIAA